MGQGSTKRVYAAKDTLLDRSVALSLIKMDDLDPVGIARVQREGQALGSLGVHPNVVTVHDVGDEEGQLYIVSEFLSGGDLRHLLDRTEGHKVPIEQALRVGLQVSQALEHAHSRGVVHRDLKPENVWFADAETAKLGDFGLATWADNPRATRVTQAGMIVGTADYVPPEVAVGGGRAADARSDLYSLGAMLYEMVTGRPPFQGDNAVAIISQHINSAPVSPTWHNSSVPPGLDELILRLLNKKPDGRIQSAGEVADALRAINSSVESGSEPAVQDAATSLDQLAGGIFVGREREVEELRKAFEDTLAGNGQNVLISGEPGIGKTRTLEELATYAQLRDAEVCWGRCYEGEFAPAYWPWVQIVCRYVENHNRQALASTMGAGAAAIAQVVPAVNRALPTLPELPTLNAEQARVRLFDSIIAFLRTAANDRPLVLILDDLHWADRSSLLLLTFVARQLQGSRLLVIGTYRESEVAGAQPLAEALAELSNMELSRRIRLSGLTEAAVARFIEMTSGRQPQADLVSTVYRETEGNPFFVTEIVRLLVADGRLDEPEPGKTWSVSIPQGVREVILHRVESLSDECRQVLTTASVVGREFAMSVLRRATPHPPDRLLELLDEACDARIIEEWPNGKAAFRFSHALVRDALYETLSHARRSSWHRQIGEVLEEFFEDDLEAHVDELAYHFAESLAIGGDVEKAINYARRAGARATAQLAYDEATAHFERALKALDRKAGEYDQERCECLLEIGDSLARQGDPMRARETFESAIEIARDHGLPTHLARAALGIPFGFGGVGPTSVRSDPDLVSLLNEGLEGLPARAGVLRSLVLSRLMMATYFTSPRSQLNTISREACDLARSSANSEALAEALNARHVALLGSPGARQRLTIADEIVALGEQANDPELVLKGRGWRLYDLVELGDRESFDAEVAQYSGLAEDLKQPEYLWYASTFNVTQCMLDGRFERAEQQAQQALAIGQGLQAEDATAFFGIQLFALRRDQGRLAEMEPLVVGAAQQNQHVALWWSALAHLYSELRRTEDAASAYERLAANNFNSVQDDANYMVCLTLLADACALLGDAARAQTLYDLLRPFEDQHVLVGGAFVCNGSVARYQGVLAGTAGAWADAAMHFDRALEKNQALGARPLVAVTEYEYARMLLRSGEASKHDEALRLVNRALGTAQELGMQGLVEKALSEKLNAQGVSYGATNEDLTLDGGSREDQATS